LWAGIPAPQAADYSIVHPVPNKSIHDRFLSETKERLSAEMVSTTDRVLAMHTWRRLAHYGRGGQVGYGTES
jgi:hypothetical protein